jgi:shikimate kinase/3-dehydroquinate synthase
MRNAMPMTRPDPHHHPSNIYLYGPSGSGKSTVGRLLADNLNRPFVDLDQEIETQSGMQIPEIFASEGEPGFRLREERVLEGVIGDQEAVIALGGGALTVPEVRTLVERNGTVITLNAPVDTLLTRLQADPIKRPLIAPSPGKEGTGTAEDNLIAYLARRKEHYASFPLRVDTGGKNPAEIAWEIQVQAGAFHLQAMAGPKLPGYDVRVQAGGLDHLGEMLKVRGLKGPVALVTDENVAVLYSARAVQSLEEVGYRTHEIILQPGEVHKNLATLSRLWDAYLVAKIERGSTVVALGGGVVGDLAGFAAAVFLRGVSWVAVPTSLLAMVDASMGGKTGADLPQGKNLIGAFYPPRFVLADPEVLKSLPEVEFNNGMAEVLKHGVIADPDLFERCLALRGDNDLADLDELVRRGMAVKVRFIEEDPYERGIRAALNYGHTVGHGVELVSDFTVRHGEAVAIGMVLEARLAERIGLANPGLSGEIAKALQHLNLPTKIPPGVDRVQIASAMWRDKKAAGGVVKFALPTAIGKVQVGVEIEGWEKAIRAA